MCMWRSCRISCCLSDDWGAARRGSETVTHEAMVRLYRIPSSRMSDYVRFDPTNAIKFTIYRE